MPFFQGVLQTRVLGECLSQVNFNLAYIDEYVLLGRPNELVGSSPWGVAGLPEKCMVANIQVLGSELS
jgi:hypothetical protein